MKPIEKAAKENEGVLITGSEDVAPIITAFLDAIQNDPEAMERVLGVMRSEPGTFLVTAIEALKQEAGR